jgi:hypothetical protein
MYEAGNMDTAQPRGAHHSDEGNVPICERSIPDEDAEEDRCSYKE